MNIHVKPIGAEAFDLEVQPSDTAADIKRQIQEIKGIPVDQQRLTYFGVKLEDFSILNNCSIENNSTLCLSVKFDMVYINYGHLTKFNVSPTDNYTIVAGKILGNEPIMLKLLHKTIIVHPGSTVGTAIQSSSSEHTIPSFLLMSYEKITKGRIFLKLKPSDTYNIVASKILEKNAIKLLHFVCETDGELRFKCISIGTGDTVNDAIQRVAIESPIHGSTPVPVESLSDVSMQTTSSKMDTYEPNLST